VYYQISNIVMFDFKIAMAITAIRAILSHLGNYSHGHF